MVVFFVVAKALQLLQHNVIHTRIQTQETSAECSPTSHAQNGIGA